MSLPQHLQFRPPQLATLVKNAPTGDQWLHEIKFDGFRILATVDRHRVTLQSRSGRDYSETFTPVTAELARLAIKNAVLDGEVAVVGADGRTSFQALQNVGQRGQLAYFVFDLLTLDGKDLRSLPLEARKARLAQLLPRSTVLRYSDHVVGRGAEVFAAACQRGLEGIVSKRRDLPYAEGRSLGWVKTKCRLRQELVIAGYTIAGGGRAGNLGAILCAYHRGPDLVYAGKVGTGFDHRTADLLLARLQKLGTPVCPITVGAPRGQAARLAHWVEPLLVAEIAFSEWTGDGRLRHPSFQGLREDKPAAEVVREVPVR
jgi:bifunctional non-homologous end joining protein LigD